MFHRHGRRILVPVLVAALTALSACSTSPTLYSHQRVLDLAARDRLWPAALAMPGIDTGPRGRSPDLAVFFDPNCPACARQYAAIERAFASLRVHWIPVGTTRGMLAVGEPCARVPPGRRQAATLLAQFDAAKALHANFADYDRANCRGAFAAASQPPRWALRAVDDNTGALARFKILGVPALVYPVAAGHGVHQGAADAKTLRRLLAAPVGKG